MSFSIKGLDPWREDEWLRLVVEAVDGSLCREYERPTSSNIHAGIKGSTGKAGSCCTQPPTCLPGPPWRLGELGAHQHRCGKSSSRGTVHTRL